MKQGFEKDLQGFGTIAKEEQGGFKVSKDVEKFEHVWEWYLEKAAQRQTTTFRDQKKIYELQKKKQTIMSRLKDELVCVDNPDCNLEVKPDTRPASYDSQKKLFRYKMEDDRELEATFGEIVTDMEWGILYSLDKGTVPRDLLKKYLVEYAKNELQRLLNSQIMISESGGPNGGKKLAYKAVEEMLGSETEKEQSGFIVEAMVKNMLRKMQYDQGASFDIIDADVYQDVEQKIDFIISLVSRNRGVEVLPDDERKDIGIQFTINKAAAKHKASQVEKSKQSISHENKPTVDDLVLVVFPTMMARNLLQQWKDDGKPAGGPDKYFHKNLAKKLFRRVMIDLLPQEQIDEYWKDFEGYFGSKQGDTNANG